MTTEIPQNVLAAIKAVVDWYRGCDGPDEILENDLPVIDAWLVELGLLPPEFCKNCGGRIPERPMRNGAVLCWDCFYIQCKHNNLLHIVHHYWNWEKSNASL